MRVPPPSDHYQRLARKAFTLVLRPRLVEKYGGQWRQQLCGGGAKAASGAAEARTWFVQEDGACGCGNGCAAARKELGYPPSAPMVDANNVHVTSDHHIAMVAWAKEKDGAFAAFAAE